MRVLILEFLYGFLEPQERMFGFLLGFPPFSFTVYSNGNVEKTFVWISSKSSASENFKFLLKVLIQFLDGGCKIIST